MEEVGNECKRSKTRAVVQKCVVGDGGRVWDAQSTSGSPKSSPGVEVVNKWAKMGRNECEALRAPIGLENAS